MKQGALCSGYAGKRGEPCLYPAAFFMIKWHMVLLLLCRVASTAGNYKTDQTYTEQASQHTSHRHSRFTGLPVQKI